MGQIAAAAEGVNTLRESDLIEPTDEVGGATYEFLTDGLRLRTIDTTGYARGHFPVGLDLADVDAVEYEWFGTENRPGIYYDIDLDGDGAPDGQLLGEQAYGGADVWLNRDAEDFTGAGGGAGTVDSQVPDGSFKSAAPCDGQVAREGTEDPCGSSGAQFHGTLENWATQLGAEFDEVTLISGGFLANGTVQDGVLQSITYGPSEYRFTNVAEPKDDTMVSLRKDQSGRIDVGDRIRLSGAVTPVTAGAEAILQQRAGGSWTNLKQKALSGAADGNSYTFRYRSLDAGRDRLRVVVPGTATSERGVSRVVTVRFR